MPSKRCFLDLDYTLYNTAEPIRLVREDLLASGSTPQAIDASLQALNQLGYSFERQLAELGYAPDVLSQKAQAYRAVQADGDRFLYPGVPEQIERLAHFADCALLTFGDPPFQLSKFNGLPSLFGNIGPTHFVWQDQTKGDVIRCYGPHPCTWFLDDSPQQLADVIEKAPWVTCIRIMWPQNTNTKPHPRDQRSWRVVTDLKHFVDLVEQI